MLCKAKPFDESRQLSLGIANKLTVYRNFGSLTKSVLANFIVCSKYTPLLMKLEECVLLWANM